MLVMFHLVAAVCLDRVRAVMLGCPVLLLLSAGQALALG